MQLKPPQRGRSVNERPLFRGSSCFIGALFKYSFLIYFEINWALLESLKPLKSSVIALLLFGVSLTLTSSGISLSCNVITSAASVASNKWLQC